MKFVKRTFQKVQELGFKETLFKMMQTNIIRSGTLVGTDALGNKYYESLDEGWKGRSRWVEYADYRNEASLVAPEWHQWLHYVSDEKPDETWTQQKFLQKYHENYSGTDYAYNPSQFKHLGKVPEGYEPLTIEQLNAELQEKQ